MRTFAAVLVLFSISSIGLVAAPRVKVKNMGVPEYNVTKITNSVWHTEAIIEDDTNLVSVANQSLVVTEYQPPAKDKKTAGVPVHKATSRVREIIVRDEAQQPAAMPSVKYEWEQPKQYIPPQETVVIQPVYVPERSNRRFSRYGNHGKPFNRGPSSWDRPYRTRSRSAGFQVGVRGQVQSGLSRTRYRHGYGF